MAESKARLVSGNFTTTGLPATIDAAVITAAGGGGIDSAAIGYEQDIFRVNHQNLSANHTIDSADNAMSAGPITVDSGVTLTVNGYWSVV